MSARSPIPIRRNPQKIEELASEGITRVIQSALPPIVEKMSWGKNELILEHSIQRAKLLHDIILPKLTENESKVYRVENCDESIEFHKKNHNVDTVNHLFGDIGLNPEVLGELNFHKVFSLYGLFSSPDYRATINAMYDHMHPGGEGFIMVPVKSVKMDLVKLIAEHENWTDFKEFHPNHDYVSPWDGDNSGKLRDALETAGFKVKEFDLVEYSYNFKNPRELADYVLSTNSFYGHLDKATAKELSDFCYDYILKTPTHVFTPGPNAANEPYTFNHICANIYFCKE